VKVKSRRKLHPSSPGILLFVLLRSNSSQAKAPSPFYQIHDCYKCQSIEEGALHVINSNKGERDEEKVFLDSGSDRKLN
jgi:hypothetical protein